MVKSKLSTKARTTIPQVVRDALDLKVGDELAFKLEADRVILTKATTSPADNSFVTFDEWQSEADRKAYAIL